MLRRILFACLMFGPFAAFLVMAYRAVCNATTGHFLF